MVFAMSMLRFFELILWVIAFIVSYFSKDFYIFAYIHQLCLGVIIYIKTVAIPLNLNWSWRMYPAIVQGFMIFFLLSIVSHAVCYYYNYIKPTLNLSWFDGLLFSMKISSNLIDIPLDFPKNIEMMLFFQSIFGAIIFFVFTSLVWWYCSQKIFDTPLDIENRNLLSSEKNLNPYKYEEDSENGSYSVQGSDESGNVIFRDNRTKKVFQFDPDINSYIDLNEKYKKTTLLNKCSNCHNSNIQLKKYYDTRGVFYPYANFVSLCKKCKKTGKPFKNPYLATFYWNKKNKI